MIFRSLLTKSFYTALHTVRCNSGIVESTIRTKLQTTLNTHHLEVVNEPTNEGSETQMRLVVVTEKFHGLPMYKRYNLINDILKEELRGGTYKLSIVAQTPIQWHRAQAAKEFPLPSDSRGGFNK